MDKIFIHALKTEAIIGIFDWERQVKQTVIVDIEISADIRKAALSDSIDDTLNYKRLAKRVSEIAIRCGRVKRDAHGKESGETVEVNIPNGVKAYEITKVEWV